MKPPQITKVMKAPQRRVWEAMTDLDSMHRMLGKVSRIEILTDGNFRVGTTWRETRKLFGKSTTETMQVTAVHEPVAYSVCAENDGVRYRSTFELVARSPETTAVTMRFNIRPMPTASRWQRLLLTALGPVGAHAAKKQMKADLDDIAHHVEQGFT